jgi:hypothetical protein
MKRILILGAVVGALAVGIVAIAGAAAQEEGEMPANHFLELLADNLGVPVEELEEALTQSHVDAVNDKVADGTISEEDAADIIERIESGEGRLFPPFGGQGGHHGKMQRLHGLVIENSAEVLGLEVDALKEELQAGNSLADVATAQGTDLEQFKADVLTAVAGDLAEKVADGSITQEQADTVLEKLTESIDRIVEFTRGDGAAGGSGDGAGSFGGARFGGGFQAPLNDGDDVDATSTIFLN